MVEIEQKLYNDIKDYCKLNGLVIKDFINKLLKKSFTVEKYGEKPFQMGNEIKPVLSTDYETSKPVKPIQPMDHDTPEPNMVSSEPKGDYYCENTMNPVNEAGKETQKYTEKKSKKRKL